MEHYFFNGTFKYFFLKKNVFFYSNFTTVCVLTVELTINHHSGAELCHHWLR